MGALRSLRERLGLRRQGDRMPAHVSIGRHTYGLGARNFVRPSPQAAISIGHYCSFGPDVLIFGQADHPTDLVSTYPFRAMIFTRGAPGADATTRGPVRIGSDVWVGARAIILSGVSIGDGAVIAAGAVVARDVAPYAVVAGSPARQVKRRLPDDQVTALLAIRWWDWPDEKLALFQDLLYGDVAAFIARAKAEDVA